MRILEEHDEIITKHTMLTLETHGGEGYQMALRDGRCICDDGPAAHARASQFAIAAGDLVGRTVAWIGGGLGVGPRVFASAGCKQTVYEIEAALAEFCPPGVTFIPGDYRTTLTGTYDVLIFDLGGEVPRDMLAAHLNPGGILLPMEP